MNVAKRQKIFTFRPILQVPINFSQIGKKSLEIQGKCAQNLPSFLQKVDRKVFGPLPRHTDFQLSKHVKSADFEKCFAPLKQQKIQKGIQDMKKESRG